MSQTKYDYVIVGAGLAGCTMARKLSEKGYSILILEKRNHIGGNIYDELDSDSNIYIQKYGPHIFHTNNERVYEYVTSISKWNEFILKCGVSMLEKFTPSPFNYKTIEQYFPITYREIIAEFEKEYPDRDTITIVELLESKNNILREYAEFLFKNDYSLYTAKQWGISPSEVDINVLKRVPVRKDYNEQYFTDIYQLMPQYGFTNFIKDMIDKDNINVKLNFDAKKIISIVNGRILIDYPGCEDCKVIYTGPLDLLFDYKFGMLPYRSLDFKYESINTSKYQDYPVVAYPSAKDFTRVTDYNQLPEQGASKTVIAYEYPKQYSLESNTDPYYPINNKETTELFNKYFNETQKIDNLILCGRLAEYKYYNMDQVIIRALELSDTI